jgi:hypothetical protein
MKKRNDSRKPRRDVIEVAFGQEQVITGMHVDETTSELKLFGPKGEVVHPARVSTGKDYERLGKSPKSLARIPSPPECIILDPTRALQRFIKIYAVDTNTKLIEGRRVSVAVSLAVKNLRFEGLRWHASTEFFGAFEFHDAKHNPERIGWANAMQRIGEKQLGGSVAIIVDAHRDQLAVINARTQPIVGSYYLPNGFELVHATSDAGTTEFLPNAVLATCDKFATEALHHIEREGAKGESYNELSPDDGRFVRFRILRPSDGAGG